MAIQTRREQLKVMNMIFQARYTEGYRLMDRAGELLNHIKKTLPEWKILGVGTILINLRHIIHPIKVGIGVDAVDLTWEGIQSSNDAEKNCETFGQYCQQFYELVTERLQSERTTRLGIRYGILAPADNLEQSDKIVCRALQSPFQKMLTDSLKMNLVDGAAQMFFEETETGLRRSVGFYSVVSSQPPGAPENIGFQLKTGEGSGGLALDVDTYTRTNSGHIGKVAVFIQQQLASVLLLATDIFLWPIKN